MTEGWRVVVAEIGKRLLQIVMAVMAEEVIRRSIKAAYLDDETIIFEKPRLARSTIKPSQERP